MNTTELERMIVRLLGDGTSYQRMIQTAEASTARAAGIIQFHSRKIESFAGSLRVYGSSARSTIAGLAALTGVVGIGGTAFESIRRYASAEQTSIAFEALIGDVQKAKATIADLTQFAADTPFELPEILGAAKQMIGFGEEAESIVATMKTLGDVSSALEIPLSSLTYLFGTLKAQGVAHTVDINQFATRGIPIWKQLEMQLGMTNAQLRKYIESSKLTFADVEKAFQATTGPMSRFRGMMEKQSKSLNGLFSTLKDNVGMTLTFIGDTLADKLQLKEGLKDLIKFTDVIRKWIPGAAQLASDAFVRLRDITTDLYERSVAKAIEFYNANQQIVHTALAVATGVLGIVVAVKALGVAIGIVGFVLGVLKFQQIAGIALWAAWAGALLIVKAAFFAVNAIFAIYNAQVAVLTFLYTMTSAAIALFTSGTLAATAATWLLNIALAVLEAETIAPLVIAAVALAATALAVFMAFETLYMIARKLVNVGTDLTYVFSNFGINIPVLDRATAIFNEWLGAMGQIVEYAKTDMPAAWEYAKLTLDLLVAHANQRLPSIWEYFRTMTDATLKYVKTVFMIEFGDIIELIKAGITGLSETTIPSLGEALRGALVGPLGEALLTLGEIALRVVGILRGSGTEEGIAKANAMDAEIDIANQKAAQARQISENARAKAKAEFAATQAAAQKALEEAQNAANDNNVQGVQKAMKKFRMNQAVAEAEEWAKQFDQKLPGAAAKTGEHVGEELSKNAIKEVHKFDAALFRSAEGAARLAEYHAALENGVAGKGKKGIPSVRNPVTGAVIARQQNPGAEAGGFAKGGPDVKDKYLSQIADSTKIMATKMAAGVILAPANLGAV